MQLEKRVYLTSEEHASEEGLEVCVVLDRAGVEAIEFPISVQITVFDGSAGMRIYMYVQKSIRMHIILHSYVIASTLFDGL